MVAPYAELQRRTMDIVDSQFGESLEISPRARGTFDRPGADGTRAVATVTGVLRMKSSTIDRGGNLGGSMLGTMEADYAVVHIQHANMPEYEIRDGDRIKALDRPGTPSFEVSRIDQGHAGRMILQVTPL